MVMMMTIVAPVPSWVERVVVVISAGSGAARVGSVNVAVAVAVTGAARVG